MDAILICAPHEREMVMQREDPRQWDGPVIERIEQVLEYLFRNLRIRRLRRLKTDDLSGNQPKICVICVILSFQQNHNKFFLFSLKGHLMTSYNQANIDRFSGFADCYDQYRPQPPVVIAEILTQLLGNPMPALVVDVGSGTGLSTRIWAGKAREVIGVEPNADMRRVAEEQTPPSAGIRYQDGLSISMGLPDDAAEIICCSQAFHWMEPEATLTEVARVLRSGGIFAAIDCDWPPTMHWQAEAAYRQLMTQVSALERRHGIYNSVKKWPKDRHLANIQASGHFRYTNEIVLHHLESGNAERLVGLVLSQGGVEGLLKIGLSEEEIGLTAFRAAVTQLLGAEQRPWYFSYRIRLGVK